MRRWMCECVLAHIYVTYALSKANYLVFTVFFGWGGGEGRGWMWYRISSINTAHISFSPAFFAIRVVVVCSFVFINNIGVCVCFSLFFEKSCLKIDALFLLVSLVLLFIHVDFFSSSFWCLCLCLWSREVFQTIIVSNNRSTQKYMCARACVHFCDWYRKKMHV